MSKYLVCFTLYLCTILYATNALANRDSLWGIWYNEEVTATERLAVLYEIGEQHEDVDSFAYVIDLQIAAATDMQQPYWLAKGIKNRAIWYSMIGQYDSAVVQHQRAIALFEKDNHLKELAHIYLQIGYNENVIGRTEEAYKWWGKAKILSEDLEQYDITATSLNAMGATYSVDGEWVKALELLLQEAHLIETKTFNKFETIEPYADIAMIYYKLNELDSALLYIEKSILYNNTYTPEFPSYNSISYGYKGQILEKQQNIAAARISYEKMLALSDNPDFEVGLIYPLAQFSKFLFNQEDEQTIIYVDSLIRLAKKHEYLADLAVGYALKGKLELAENNSREASQLCASALNILDESAITDDLLLVYDCLYESYKARQMYKQALIFYERSQQLKQEEVTETNIRQLTQLEMRAIADREKEVAQLAYDNQLQRQRFIQYGLIGGLGLVGLLAFVSYRNYRSKAKANQLIEAQKAELEQLNATKDRLFAIIGHDLRKPSLAFRGIGKKVDYLLKKEDYSTLTQLTASLEKAAFALNSLLDNLLNWALQQRNVLPYQPQPINAKAAAAEIEQYFKEVAADKDIHLAFEIDPQTQVFADPNAFTTIIRNLVDNAIKFTPKNGEVKIMDEVTASQVVLKVEDSGIGMINAELTNLFALTSKRSTKGTHGESGTGLGLSLVQELVKLNKGEISVESQLQQGTIFEVSLPRYRKELLQV